MKGWRLKGEEGRRKDRKKMKERARITANFSLKIPKYPRKSNAKKDPIKPAMGI